MAVKGWIERRKICSKCKSMVSPLSKATRCGRCGGDLNIGFISATGL